MKHLSLLTACLLLSGVAQAQSLVLSDNFNDGVLDPMWTQTFDPFQFWDVSEGNGAWNFDGLTAPFGALDERFVLTADVPGFLPGDFQLDMALSWNDQVGFNPGENAELFVVRLYDAGGVDLATFTMDDSSTTNAGDFRFEGGSTTTVSAIPANSSGTFSLVRDAADNISFTLDVVGGPSTGGSLGVSPGTVAKVEFYVSHTTLCGPCGPFLGQLHVDDLQLYDGPIVSGPTLSTAGLVAGGLAQFDVAMASPGGNVILAASRTGAGPTPTLFGDADLSLPITQFPAIVADPAGDASISFTVPAQAAGAPVWFQALDLSAGLFTNGLAEIVQ